MFHHHVASSYAHDSVACELSAGWVSVGTDNPHRLDVRLIGSAIHSISVGNRADSDCYRTMRTEWDLSDRRVRVIDRSGKHFLWTMFVPTICLNASCVVPVNAIDLSDSKDSLVPGICPWCHEPMSYVFDQYYSHDRVTVTQSDCTMIS